MASPTQFAYRTSKAIGIIDAAPVYEPVVGFQRPDGNIRCCLYSPDGRYFAYASAEKVTIVDASVGHVVNTLLAPNVYELGFSPKGTYIITWQRPSKDDNGDAVKNLKVWKVENEGDGGGDAPDDERNVVGRFVQRSQTGWNLQYTSDEKHCARVVTNEVQFFESHDLRTVWNKLHIDGVADFALPPGKSSSVAVFVPERKGQPASVRIYAIPDFATPVSQKSFFKGDKVQLKWNNLGTSLIVLAQTEVDKSNQSYYGETTLYLLSANGGFDSRIDLDKEGPIHDVTWSPNSNEFGVVYGFMPARTVIFNSRAKEVHSFALGPRNTITFSPHARFVLVAGFGNLAGDVDIYDLDKDYKKITSFQASNASICEWSPDGKFLMTAITSPRLRVDNGVRIWHVSGGIIYDHDMTELYHVAWRPQGPDQHPLGDPFNPVPTPHESAIAYLGRVKTPTKPVGAYRPPGARGTTTPLAFMREDQGGAAYVRGAFSAQKEGGGFGLAGSRSIPGAEAVDKSVPGAAAAAADGDENLSAAALKNKKKREAKKAKAAAERAARDTLAPADGTKQRSGSRSRSKEGRDRADRGGDRNGSRNRPRSNSDYRPTSDYRPASRDRRGERSRSRSRDDRVDRITREDWIRRDPPAATTAATNGTAANSAIESPVQSPREAKAPSGPTLAPASAAGANGISGGSSSGGGLAVPGPTSNGSAGAPRGGLLKLDTVAGRSSAAAAAAAPPTAPDLTVTTPGGGTSNPTDKKIRSLTKKLRAIDDLKMRLAEGVKLEATQIQKIATEEGVRKELSQLGWKDE